MMLFLMPPDAYATCRHARLITMRFRLRHTLLSFDYAADCFRFHAAERFRHAIIIRAYEAR